MSKEAFVSFETAKLLKEKGFNEECFALYNPDGVLIQSGIRLNNIQVGRVKGSYSAPTQQMAMRWLREKYLIFFDFRLVLGDTEDGKFMVGVYDMTSLDTYTWKTWVYGNTYEETYEKAIKYVLDNNFFIDDDDE